MWYTIIYLLSAVLQIDTVSSTRTARPKSRCEKWRIASFRVPFSYVPTCNLDGSFTRRQCHFTAKQILCWEVDKFGNQVKPKTPYRLPHTKHVTDRQRTRTLQPITNDARASDFLFGRYSKTDRTTENEIVERYTKTQLPITTKPLTKCERMRNRRTLAQFKTHKTTMIPQCTRDGHFQREQCNSDKTKCWCVGKTGKRIPGTKVRHQFPNCYPGTCGLRFNKSPSRQRRVVGGRESAPRTWPWQALVLFSDPKHICGATLVRRNWLVTAASCFDGFTKRRTEWNVKLGVHKLNSSDDEKLSVETIHIHPKYKPGNKTSPGDYDVALIQVTSSARIPRNIMPLCLPDKLDFYRQGARCSITGWGHTSYNGSLSRVLREAWVDLVPLHECNSEKSYNGTINDRFMCAGYKEGGMDACHFDTGGPLACPVAGGVWALAGIVSWRQSCAQPFKYGVYTNVYEVKPWIERIIKR
ncbi:transmembrane protease serine 11E-like [Dendronephthya gigantea]|uniref:transmembrane protease serine 11E-like n=1 Tax=Dendronephthya gigantea TaxID=151771 RepID=UPI00106C56D9|nr:transmembrane protease serine 11E-like [Dendronephthya gigantea]